MLLIKLVVGDSQKLSFVKEITANGFVEDIEKVLISHLVLLIKILALKLILKI